MSLRSLPQRVSWLFNCFAQDVRLALSALFLFGLLGFRLQDRFWKQDLRITFFDVGQGDSFLLEWPDRDVWLVDAGGGFGKFSIGKAVLEKELLRKSILKLDRVLISHPDRDHIFGLLYLLRQFPVGEIVFSSFFKNASIEILNAVLREASFRNIPIRFVEDQRAHKGSYQVHLFSGTNRSLKANDHSLLLELSSEQCRVLLTGDIEKIAEESILNYLERPVDLLKVAHHGSNTSSSWPFLFRAVPQVAIISAGHGNSYGHPHPNVLKRLIEIDAQVFRTDIDGYLEAVMGPTTIKVRSFSDKNQTFLCRSK